MITPPRNHVPLAKDAAQHVLIAGGIGVTPFLAMIERLAAEGADWTLHYCVRRRTDAAFAERLLLWHSGRVRLHVTQGDASARLDMGALLRELVAGTHVYCCGPAGLMAAVHEASRHWPAGHVHFEAFQAASPPGVADCASFTATIASAGQAIKVGPEVSLLDALRAHGIDVLASCEVGTCGTCRLDLRDGRVDHRDMVFTARERATSLMACVSRGIGDVVLDLRRVAPASMARAQVLWRAFHGVWRSQAERSPRRSVQAGSDSSLS
jgi:ferredoxin